MRSARVAELWLIVLHLACAACRTQVDAGNLTLQHGIHPYTVQMSEHLPSPAPVPLTLGESLKETSDASHIRFPVALTESVSRGWGGGLTRLVSSSGCLGPQ